MYVTTPCVKFCSVLDKMNIVCLLFFKVYRNENFQGFRIYKERGRDQYRAL